MLESERTSKMGQEQPRPSTKRGTELEDGSKYCLWHGTRSMELTEGKLTVGRSRHCDLSIQEPSISRKHVFMTVERGEIRVQDLGSSNGTFVNDAKVQGESVLRNGDQLRLGNAELEVRILRGESDAAGPNEKDPEKPSVQSPKSESDETSAPWMEPSKDRVREIATPSNMLDDPDLVPTKHLDQPSIDWDLLKLERAGFWPRLAAVAVDGLAAAILSWVGHLLLGKPGALLGPVAFLVTTWLGWGIWGTTPGKHLLRLYVYAIDDVERTGRPGTGLMVSAIRVASSILSLLLFGLGFLAIAFSPMRQALHDRLARTFVVRGRPGGVKSS